ncbi:hypothetical protein E5676_scaffold796G00300 [Cucumis melo var. makuwa]|uniref:Reverse transcriptase/retrotransposon-derived protein RNase H-like domain-containing protein n=1 Tax=Cucumis melo var. makuwa TaxID=1194695 RepID=A0A5D3CAE1_CUCMM|nr:hypothetical protein E5676_scaffold796G00300 [Cucumis melo var. makuwa]
MVFLGRVVSADGVSVDLQKIGVVVNWERAIIVKELEKCEQSFQELKKQLVTTPILILHVTRNEYVVYCDASIQGSLEFQGVLYMASKLERVEERYNSCNYREFRKFASIVSGFRGRVRLEIR